MGLATNSRPDPSATTGSPSGSRLATAANSEAARRLRFEKMRATSLFVFATIVYLLMVFVFGHDGWRGYVEATAEAAMVGALADWFAVTALFRHPLGLPIPHTAIVRKRKDEIGETLGTFIQENFLQSEILADRITEAGVADRLAAWLESPENATKVADQSATVISGMLDVLKDEEIQSTLNDALRKRAESLDLAPVMARTIEFAVDGGHHRTMFDASLRGVETMLDDNRETMREQLERESPWWVPETLDDRVFAKIYAGVQNFISEINATPNHPVRQKLDERIRTTAQRLRDSPELAERAEEIKRELLEHPDAQEWVDNLWVSLKDEIRRAAETPESDLRLRLRDLAISAGDTLRADEKLRAKVDGWLATVAGQLAQESQNEVADLIASTVKGWDAEETSDLIELQIGRDLQFIRINGTIVGGLAGLVIHTLTQVFS